MSEPTYEDANVMLQFAQFLAMIDYNDALSWTRSDEFDPDFETFLEKHPIGSNGYKKVTTVLGAMETIGALWNNGLFNEKLLFDWIGVKSSWDRVGGIARGLRERAGSPTLYEHFEAMAMAQDS